jgi:hypothetical protein
VTDPVARRAAHCPEAARCSPPARANRPRSSRANATLGLVGIVGTAWLLDELDDCSSGLIYEYESRVRPSPIPNTSARSAFIFSCTAELFVESAPHQ